MVSLSNFHLVAREWSETLPNTHCDRRAAKKVWSLAPCMRTRERLLRLQVKDLFMSTFEMFHHQNHRTRKLIWLRLRNNFTHQKRYKHTFNDLQKSRVVDLFSACHTFLLTSPFLERKVVQCGISKITSASNTTDNYLRTFSDMWAKYLQGIKLKWLFTLKDKIQCLVLGKETVWKIRWEGSNLIDY